jgi:hypothetical protein
MTLSKSFYRSMDFTTNVTIKKIKTQQKRQSRKLAVITLTGNYPDGTRFNLCRDARSNVHQCR